MTTIRVGRFERGLDIDVSEVVDGMCRQRWKVLCQRVCDGS